MERTDSGLEDQVIAASGIGLPQWSATAAENCWTSPVSSVAELGRDRHVLGRRPPSRAN